MTGKFIHWSKEPLLAIHSVKWQPMARRKPYGLWFSVGDGADGWRAWCDGPDGQRLDLPARRRPRFRYRTEIALAQGEILADCDRRREGDSATTFARCIETCRVIVVRFLLADEQP